jgi:hypothetical protein
LELSGVFPCSPTFASRSSARPYYKQPIAES